MAGVVLEKPLEVLPALDTTLVDVQRKVLEETAVQAWGGGGEGGTAWVSSQSRDMVASPPTEATLSHCMSPVSTSYS